MSEFQEKLQAMKEGMTNALEDNPAIISSNLIDSPSEVMPTDQQEDEPSRSQLPERNERGHRKRKTVRDKLEVVLAENRAKDAQQQQLMAYIQEQERRLAEAEAKAEQNAHYSNVYYEQSLENDEQRILTELEIAKESGDIKKEVAMQQKLAEIAAQKQTQLLSKTLQRNQPQPASYQEPTYYPQPQYQQKDTYQEEPINEYYEDWLEENPWADPRSSEYDSSLSQEVNDIAVELNKNLKFKRHGHMIGTPEYYGALSNIMNERYGGNPNNNYNNSEYEDNRAGDLQPYEVAPVTKRGSSMAERYVSNNPATNRQIANNSPSRRALTKDQYQVAVNLAPVLSKIYNRNVSVEEAIGEYLNQEKLIAQQQKYNY